MVGCVINDEVRALVQGKNFATISTLLPKGEIQTHVVWVDCDDRHIVINTEVELRKFKNVQAEARANINALAQKYLGADYPDEWIHSERVILKIAPDSQIVFARGMHDIRR